MIKPEIRNRLRRIVAGPGGRTWIWPLAAVLLVAALFWAGWYINERGFTKRWRFYLKQEFAERGLDIEIDRLTLDPVRGLVARDVRFISGQSGDRVGSTGTIGQVSLDVNYASLMRGTEFLNAADLRDTELIIPLGEGQEPLVVRNLSARIFFPDDEILIRQFRADFHDLRVNGEFRLMNYQARAASEAGSSENVGKGPAGSAVDDSAIGNQSYSLRLSDELIAFFRVINREASRIKAQGEVQPLVNVRLESDLLTSDLLNSEVSFKAEDFQRDDVHYDRAEALIWLREGQVTLKNALLRRGNEQLQTTGSLDLDSLRGRFRFDSATQVQEFLREFVRHPLLRELVFYDSPQISALGELDLRGENPVRILGTFKTGRTLFRSVLFENLQADFSWQSRDQWMIHDLKLTHRGGRATVAARMLPGDFRASASCEIAGEAVAPILGTAASQFLKDWEFFDPPRIELDVRGPSPDVTALQYTGALNVGRARFRGKWLQSASSQLAGDFSTIEYRDFHLVRDEGEVRGTVSYPLANPHRVQFNNVRSTINVQDGAAWFGEGISRAVAPYRFVTPPRLHINGVADFSDAPATDLQIRLEAEDGLDWEFFERNLHFESVEALLFLKEGQLGIRNARARVYEGEAELNLIVDLEQTHNAGFAGRLTLAGAEFAPFARFVWPESDLPEATLGGALHFQNTTNQREDFEASGLLEIAGDGLLQLPLFGEISRPLRMFAGKETRDGGGEEPNLMSRFVFTDGQITAESLDGEAGDLRIEGYGVYETQNQQMDLVLKARTHTLEEGLLSPFSDLLSFRGTGTPQSPQWRLERFVPPPTETAHPTEPEVDMEPESRATRYPRQLPRSIARP